MCLHIKQIRQQLMKLAGCSLFGLKMLASDPGIRWLYGRVFNATELINKVSAMNVDLHIHH